MAVLINDQLQTSIDVPDAVVDDYLKQGWQRPGTAAVEAVKPVEKPKPSTRRRTKTTET